MRSRPLVSRPWNSKKLSPLFCLLTAVLFGISERSFVDGRSTFAAPNFPSGWGVRGGWFAPTPAPSSPQPKKAKKAKKHRKATKRSSSIASDAVAVGSDDDGSKNNERVKLGTSSPSKTKVTKKMKTTKRTSAERPGAAFATSESRNRKTIHAKKTKKKSKPRETTSRLPVTQARNQDVSKELPKFSKEHQEVHSKKAQITEADPNLEKSSKKKAKKKKSIQEQVEDKGGDTEMTIATSSKQIKSNKKPKRKAKSRTITAGTSITDEEEAVRVKSKKRKSEAKRLSSSYEEISSIPVGVKSSKRKPKTKKKNRDAPEEAQMYTRTPVDDPILSSERVEETVEEADTITHVTRESRDEMDETTNNRVEVLVEENTGSGRTPTRNEDSKQADGGGEEEGEEADKASEKSLGLDEAEVAAGKIVEKEARVTEPSEDRQNIINVGGTGSDGIVQEFRAIDQTDEMKNIADDEIVLDKGESDIDNGSGSFQTSEKTATQESEKQAEPPDNENDTDLDISLISDDAEGDRVEEGELFVDESTKQPEQHTAEEVGNTAESESTPTELPAEGPQHALESKVEESVDAAELSSEVSETTDESMDEYKPSLLDHHTRGADEATEDEAYVESVHIEKRADHEEKSDEDPYLEKDTMVFIRKVLKEDVTSWVRESDEEHIDFDSETTDNASNGTDPVSGTRGGFQEPSGDGTNTSLQSAHAMTIDPKTTHDDDEGKADEGQGGDDKLDDQTPRKQSEDAEETEEEVKVGTNTSLQSVNAMTIDPKTTHDDDEGKADEGQGGDDKLDDQTPRKQFEGVEETEEEVNVGISVEGEVVEGDDLTSPDSAIKALGSEQAGANEVEVAASVISGEETKARSLDRLTLESSEDLDTDAVVSVVTWNLAEESPSETDASFIRHFRKCGIAHGTGSDLVLISGQECENIKPRRSEGRRSREYRRLMIKMLGKQYVPIALHLLGGIQFGLFAKRSFLKEIEHVSVADVTCGIGNVFHNKGAIAAFVRLKARNPSSNENGGNSLSKSLRMVFVTSHMAAHVKNSDARDSDFWRISSELEAQAPEGFLPRKSSISAVAGSESFLFDSVDRAFFCGDLNYR